MRASWRDDVPHRWGSKKITIGMTDPSNVASTWTRGHDVVRFSGTELLPCRPHWCESQDDCGIQ